MALDPRVALDELVAAFRVHLDVAVADADPESEAVLDAAAVLADAFDAYDEALFDACGVDTPLDLVDSDELDDDDLDDSDDDDLDDDDELEDDEFEDGEE
ncbi:MAG: DNA primase [Beutenbergiaceae bacterium]